MTAATATLIIPDDVVYGRDEIAAIGFLARYKEPTRTLYTTNLRQWFEWCAQRGIKPLAASRTHIELWSRQLEEVNCKKASTVRNKLTAVCGFYRMAYIDKLIPENPAEYLRKPRVARQTTTEALTRSELHAVLDAAEKSENRQDFALLCILGLCGLRIGEILAINVEDLGRQGGYRTLDVRREKGNRQGVIPLVPKASWAVDLHLGPRTTGPLFRMKPDGNRMDRKAADRVIKRTLKEAGIAGKRITPHSFRHTFLTLALDSGVSIRNCINSMGYADGRMVSYYDHGKSDLSRHAAHMMAAYVEGC